MCWPLTRLLDRITVRLVMISQMLFKMLLVMCSSGGVLFSSLSLLSGCGTVFCVVHACDRRTKHLYLFGCHLPAAKKKKKRERERRKKEQLAAFVPELNEMVRAGCSGSPRVLISITFT